jgi:hypothetical protein
MSIMHSIFNLRDAEVAKLPYVYYLFYLREPKPFAII